MTTLRYVILRHEGVPSPHFDLMFETSHGSALTSWRSDRWPIDRATVLTRLADHRREYLDYEGPVSGDRGFVARVASGTFTLQQLDEGFWTIRLSDSLMPTLNLKRGDGDEWLAVPSCGC